jgi:hypothetical protein
MVLLQQHPRFFTITRSWKAAWHSALTNTKINCQAISRPK